MGIIAWIVLGLAAGLIGNMLIPGRRSQGLFITCLIGVAGALGGGWVATKVWHIHTLNGFFNASTWLTAIAGAAVLLLAYHLFSGQTSRRTARRSCAFEHRRAVIDPGDEACAECRYPTCRRRGLLDMSASALPGDG